jgi:hypothetical protein
VDTFTRLRAAEVGYEDVISQRVPDEGRKLTGVPSARAKALAA